MNLNQVETWNYVLGGDATSEVPLIVNSNADLVVLSQIYTKSQVSQIENSGPHGSRIALGYLDISEYGTYLPGWNPSWVSGPNYLPNSTAPDWLGAPNGGYTANGAPSLYSANVGKADWLPIIEGQINSAIASGYNGVFLDAASGWMAFAAGNTYGNPVDPNAAANMAHLLEEIYSYVHTTLGLANFTIMVNNAHDLFAANPELVNSIDAELVEASYWTQNPANGLAFGPGPTTYYSYVSKDLDPFRATGKPIFAADYIPQPSSGTTYLTPGVNYNLNYFLLTLADGYIGSLTSPAQVASSIALFPNYSYGSARADAIAGVTGRDNYIYGGAGNDQLTGAGTGLNVLAGGSGNDTLIGSTAAGATNEALYLSTKAGHTVQANTDGSLTVSGGSDGSDVLKNIQAIVFSDTIVTLATPASINAIYDNFMGRDAGSAEIAVWQALIYNGESLSDLRNAVLGTANGRTYTSGVITQLYDGYFGRDPSSSEVTVWLNALQSGSATLASLNTVLANDPSGKAFSYLSIKGSYDAYMGRDPLAAEVSYWTKALQGGTYTLQGFEKVLAAQSGAAANEAAFVTQAYQTWLGRAPTTSDLTYWTGQLNNGTTTPLQLREALVNDASGQAHIAAVITADYQADFGRVATASEITTWKGLIAGGASFTTLTSALLGDGAGVTAKTITSAYDSYFGRDPTNAEMGVWRGLFANGSTAATLRSALVNDASGVAHSTSEITSLYQTYFGRAPTTAETNTWKGLITGGSPFTQMHDALVGDGAGKAHAAAEIGPLYQAIEGRAPTTSDTAYWTGVFNSGASNLDKFIDVLLHDAGSQIATTTLAAGHAATTFVDPLEMLVINGFGSGDQINFHGATFDGYNPLDHAVQVGADVLIYGPDPTHVVLLENEQLSSLSGANFLHV